MKQITIERLSTPEANNQTGQRLKHDWSKLPYIFPPEYKEFLELFNGYCGFLGTSYVDLMQFEELFEMNELYGKHGTEEWFLGMTAIGGNGGGMGYAINQDGQYLYFDMTGDFIEVLADNFDDFIDYVFTYDWGDEE